MWGEEADEIKWREANVENVSCSSKKELGKNNNLIESPYFTAILHQLDHLLDPNTFEGIPSQQVTNFLNDEVDTILQGYQQQLKKQNTPVVLKNWINSN